MDEINGAIDVLGTARMLELIYGSSEVFVVFIYMMGLFSFYMTFRQFGKLGQINQGSNDVWSMSSIAWTFIGGVFFVYIGSFIDVLHETMFVSSWKDIEGGSPLSWRINDGAGVEGMDAAVVAIKTVTSFFQFLGLIGIYLGVRNLQKIGRSDLGQDAHNAAPKAFWHIIGGLLLLNPIGALSGVGFFIPMLGDLATNMSNAVSGGG
jgi:hypothetical protein